MAKTITAKILIMSSTGTRVLLVLASLVIVIAGLKAASTIIVPLLMALFIAIITTPFMLWLTGKGVTKWAALGLILLMLAGFILTVGSLISSSVDQFSALLPAYENKLRTAITLLSDWAARHQLTGFTGGEFAVVDPKAAAQIIGGLVGSLGRIVGDSLLIFFTVVFLLVEASTIPTKIRAILSDPDTTLERLSEFLSAVKQYLVIKSLTSLITGVIVTAWLFFLGVDFAVLWGSIAFFMNFVPYVGSIIAAVPVVFLAFLDAGVQDALLVAVGFLAINLVVGNLIEPRFMGRGLGLSTLVVFVSLIFWGWVFGPVGMFLSAPLTMLVKIALENDPRSRWIAILLSSGSLRRQ
ncbi:MAG: AI-2E family transporter [Arenicellales bacterium]|nr:AI-2E family transporter [Arenicellales bacterium]